MSTAGGRQPLWARNGKELFYFGADNALLRVPVEASGATWSAGTPMKILDGRYYTGTGTGLAYDVSVDGQRFLMIKGIAGDSAAQLPRVILVQNFDGAEAARADEVAMSRRSAPPARDASSRVA